MTDYRLEVTKDMAFRKYNIRRHYKAKEIKVNTFAEVINTIYEFKSESGVFNEEPILTGLTEEEEKAIHETRKGILKVLELEKERERILRVSSKLEKLVHPSLKKFTP